MVKKSLSISVLLIALMIAVVLWASQWSGGLEKVPVHWDIHGNPDRFETPQEMVKTLWTLIGVSAVMTAIFSIWPALDPKRGNLHKSSKAYFVAWIGTLTLMLGVICLFVFAMRSSTVSGSGQIWQSFPRLAIAGCAILIIALGNYLPKTRSNWILGVRTPWSLSNDIVWEKTQRVGGYGLVFGGVASLIAAFVTPVEWLITIFLVAVLIPSIWAVIYSYLVWRKGVGTQ